MIQLGLLPDSSNDHGDSAIPRAEEPRSRLENYGAPALSDIELIATILQGTNLPPERALAVARRLVTTAGSIAGLATWTIHDYQKFDGIGPARASQLGTLTEIARRMMRPTEASPLLNRPELIAQHFQPITAGLEIEKFWVVCLNRKNRLKRLVEVTSGTATASLAHPREVFRAAIQNSSSAVICVHNHPSGDPAPSAADIQVTRVLREAAKTVDIELLDHVVVGRVETDPTFRGYYSFREAGLV